MLWTLQVLKCGRESNKQFIQWVCSALTILLFFVTGCNIYANIYANSVNKTLGKVKWFLALWMENIRKCTAQAISYTNWQHSLLVISSTIDRNSYQVTHLRIEILWFIHKRVTQCIFSPFVFLESTNSLHMALWSCFVAFSNRIVLKWGFATTLA